MKRLTQQEKILKLLRDAKGVGINSFTVRKQFIQLPVRIMELKSQGYDITSITRRDKSVDYILNKEPETPKKIIDWDFSTGNARPIYEGATEFSNSPKPHDTATDVSLFQ